LKTKRLSNNTKVFVNVLTLPAIYFDSPSQLFLHSSHQTEDKGGESCDVFDLCCHEQALLDQSSQSPDALSSRCVSILQQLNTQRHDTLDLDYKTPKIKGNYKSGGIGGNQPIKLFHSLKQVERATATSSLGTTLANTTTTAHSALSSSDTSAPVVTPPVSLAPVPSVMQGWMKKEGHQFKTIKRRYFVLQEGELRYYERPLATPPFGEKLKGTFSLKDGSVEFGVGDGKALGRDGNKRLFIQAAVSPPLSVSLSLSLSLSVSLSLCLSVSLSFSLSLCLSLSLSLVSSHLPFPSSLVDRDMT
jgi:hypothetical protein